MARSFLGLARADRADILLVGSTRLGRTAQVLEKDVWVCWVLARLFEMPGRVKMAFKGGTSLSKVHGVIARFSEDVDITLDHTGLRPGCDPLEPGLSGSQRTKRRGELEKAVTAHVAGVVKPYLEGNLASDLGANSARVVVEGKEGLRVEYESAVDDGSTYMTDSILIEFGGRNPIEPSGTIPIRTYLAELDHSEFDLPIANVNVLAAKRTFWEKATLIHVECTRPPREATPRMSRHWYDLAKLADHDIGEEAMQDRALLESVVACKSLLFAVKGADYGDCTRGKLVLVPHEPTLGRLRADFEKMVGSKMFIGAAPDFDGVMARLKQLELQINSMASNLAIGR